MQHKKIITNLIIIAIVFLISRYVTVYENISIQRFSSLLMFASAIYFFATLYQYIEAYIKNQKNSEKINPEEQKMPTNVFQTFRTLGLIFATIVLLLFGFLALIFLLSGLK